MAEDKAVVLLSGGLDSATTLAIAKQSGFSLYALTFRYGQRHQCEIEGAKRVARSIGVVEHKVIPIDMGGIGGSALTDLTIEVPKDRKGLGQPGDEIPLTYVPAQEYDIFELCAGVGGGAKGIRYFSRRQRDGLQRVSRLQA